MPRPLAVHLVGSWSRPAWLASPDVKDALGTPDQFWRTEPAYLLEAQNDATRLAILDQLEAGVDIVTDGEQRRQIFDRYFYGRLSGVDSAHPIEHTWGGPAQHKASQTWRQVAQDLAQSGGPPRVPSPRVVGAISWSGPLAVDDFRFLDQAVAGRRLTKMTMSGPITALNRLADQWYHDRSAMGRDIAQALNREAHALADAGCRYIQFDEPEFRTAHLTSPEESLDLINRTVAGLKDRGVTTYAHMCYGYANAVLDKTVNPDFYAALELMAQSAIDGVSIEYAQPGHEPGVLKALGTKRVILGAINCAPTSPVETPEAVASLIRRALDVVPPARLHTSTDCGVWFLPRDRAMAKLRALVEGTHQVRRELGL